MNSRRSITYISDNNDLTTLINVFVVDAENQEKLVKVLQEATESIIHSLPGLFQQIFIKVWMVLG
jgi:glycerol-3-phosphate responsive antiterminator